jgi:hypothetical protein
MVLGVHLEKLLLLTKNIILIWYPKVFNSLYLKKLILSLNGIQSKHFIIQNIVLVYAPGLYFLTGKHIRPVMYPEFRLSNGTGFKLVSVTLRCKALKCLSNEAAHEKRTKTPTTF